MKKRIVTRQKKSAPPSRERVEWLYGQIYKVIEKNNPVTQQKIAVKNSEGIFVLQEIVK